MCLISRWGSSSLSFIFLTRACNLLKSWQSHSAGCLSPYSSADSDETNSEPLLFNGAYVRNLMRLYWFFIYIPWKNEVAFKKEAGRHVLGTKPLANMLQGCLATQYWTLKKPPHPLSFGPNEERHENMKEKVWESEALRKNMGSLCYRWKGHPDEVDDIYSHFDI